MCAVLVSRAAQAFRRLEGVRSVKDRNRKQPDSVNQQIMDIEEAPGAIQTPDSVTDLVKGEDALQSMQYNLVATEVRVEGQKGTYLVHLGFCGIHNRHRLPEFYGLFPGGSFYDEATRIPPLR